jgi:hypothetical protein
VENARRWPSSRICGRWSFNAATADGKSGG